MTKYEKLGLSWLIIGSSILGATILGEHEGKFIISMLFTMTAMVIFCLAGDADDRA